MGAGVMDLTGCGWGVLRENTPVEPAQESQADIHGAQVGAGPEGGLISWCTSILDAFLNTW
jgi:hypothetical protein